MSKKSQREARERKEQSERDAHLRFSTTLRGYLNTFASLFRQDVTEEGAAAYGAALRHLSPDELKLACDEATRRCKFFPNPAEILESLKVARERMTFGTGAPLDESDVMSKEEREAIGRQILEAGRKLAMPRAAREPGLD